MECGHPIISQGPQTQPVAHDLCAARENEARERTWRTILRAPAGKDGAKTYPVYRLTADGRSRLITCRSSRDAAEREAARRARRDPRGAWFVGAPVQTQFRGVERRRVAA